MGKKSINNNNINNNSNNKRIDRIIKIRYLLTN